MSATQIDPQHEHWDTECKLCGEWFTKRGMKTHIATKHKSDSWEQRFEKFKLSLKYPTACPYCMFTSPYSRPRSAIAIHVRRSHKDKYLSRDDKIKAFIAKEIKLAGVKATKITALKDTNVPKTDSIAEEIEEVLRNLACYDFLQMEDFAGGENDLDFLVNRAKESIVAILAQALTRQRIALIEQIKGASPDMPDEMKGLIDDHDDYQTGFTDAKLKILTALRKEV